MSTSSPAPTPSAVPAAEHWVAAGFVRTDTTSTSSQLQPGGKVRTYFMDGASQGAIVFAESSDGRDLSHVTVTSVKPGVVPGAAFVSNPAVLRLADGSYAMVFEGTNTPPPNQGSRHLYGAASKDGVTFSTPVELPTSNKDFDPRGQLFQSVPSLFQTKDGVVHLFYVSAGIFTASMTSMDGGGSWTPDSGYRLGERGNNRAAYVDPDPVLQEDGSVALYFAYSEFEPQCGGLGCQRIAEAVSSDGKTFAVQPDALLTPPQGTAGLVDPDVFQTADGSWHMLYGQAAGRGIELHAADLSTG